MIIRFPTGEYQDAGQLPKSPSDPTSVTFTISNDDPKRPQDSVLQLPISQELAKRDPPIFDDQERRVSMGELIFTIVSANRADPGSNTKTFAIGEFLEFSDEQTIPVSQPSIPLLVDIPHNTNQLDLVNSGLNEQEIAAITAQSTVKKKELEDSLSQIQVQILNGQTAITENQKDINEVRKVISAVQQILPPADPIMVKLNSNLQTLLAQRDTLTNQLNDNNVQATQIYNALLAVSNLVL